VIKGDMVIARKLANKMYKLWINSLSQDEAYQCAYIGMMTMRASQDPNKMAGIKTFAYIHVRREIIEEIRLLRNGSRYRKRENAIPIYYFGQIENDELLVEIEDKGNSSYAFLRIEDIKDKFPREYELLNYFYGGQSGTNDVCRKFEILSRVKGLSQEKIAVLIRAYKDNIRRYYNAV